MAYLNKIQFYNNTLLNIVYKVEKTPLLSKDLNIIESLIYTDRHKINLFFSY
jgi:hypothetical protein